MDYTTVFNISRIVGALVMGVALGLVPLITGLKKDKKGLAIGGFFACLVGTFILGLILGAPICAVFTYLINKKSEEVTAPQSENFQQSVEENNDDQQAM